LVGNLSGGIGFRCFAIEASASWSYEKCPSISKAEWKLHLLKSDYDTKDVCILIFILNLSQLDNFSLFTEEISRKSEIPFFAEYSEGR
jgi:hypothetical protein